MVTRDLDSPLNATRNYRAAGGLVGQAGLLGQSQADYPTKRTHPYAKPVEPFLHVMRRICRAGDLVVDPFAGSGVSRTAAESLGLEWQGCDIDPNYADPVCVVCGMPAGLHRDKDETEHEATYE